MARSKKPSTTGDMVRSLLVILLPLLVITFLFTDLPRDHPVKVVDWPPIADAARRQAPFPVLAPTDLPAGWRATQANWVKEGNPDQSGQRSPRSEWELDFLNPDDKFVGLTQADLQLDDLIKTETREGRPDGSIQIGGRSWERRVSADGRTRSLLLVDAKSTAIVSGDLPYEALEDYAGRLTTG